MTNWKRVPCSDFVSLYVITTLNSVLLSLAFGPVPWWCWMMMVIQDLRETQRRFPSGLPFQRHARWNWTMLYFWIKSDDRLKRQTWWKRSCKPKTVIVCSSLCSGSMWKCIRSSRGPFWSVKVAFVNNHHPQCRWQRVSCYKPDVSPHPLGTSDRFPLPPPCPCISVHHWGCKENW